MATRTTWLGVLVATTLLLAPRPAQGVILRLTPLKDVLEESTYVFVAKVDAVDAKRPALVLALDRHLKGKAPFAKMPVNLKGDAVAAKGKETAALLKRVAPKVPVVLFVSKRDKDYIAFAYTNGTWFGMTGSEAGGVVRWSFLHCEPYLRRTFKGTTAEMVETVAGVLAGKRKPPPANAKEKPGLGPELEPEEPKKGAAAPSSGPPFAVIPTVLVGGPLAVLAMLFPALFAGLLLVLRRWMVALTVLSVNSTLYLAQQWFLPRLLASWYGTSSALWLTMSAVTLVGILWAWRRHLARLAVVDAPAPAELPPEPQPVPFASDVPLTLTPLGSATPSPTGLPVRVEERARAPFAEDEPTLLGPFPSKKRGAPVDPPALAPAAPGDRPSLAEAITLVVLSAVALGAVLYGVSASPARWDTWDRILLMFSAGLWLATLHCAWRAWRARGARPALSGEGVMLGAMMLAAVVLGDTVPAGAGAAAGADAGGCRVAWRFRPKEPCWIASSPHVAGGRVYVGVVHGAAFRFGAVYCLDAATGEVVWTFNDGGKMKDSFSSPVVAAGRVYVGEGFHQHLGCKLYCLDADTGKKLWEFATASHTEATPVIDGGRVYVGAGDDGLYCLDAQSGKKKWHYEGLHVDATPLVVGGRLYGGSGVGDYHKDTALFCLDAATGQQVWRTPTDLPVWGTPALEGGRLYAGVGNGNFLESADKPAGAVLCLDAKSGKRVWRYDARDGVLSRTVVRGGTVYFAARDGYCYAVDRETARLGWKVSLGSPVVACPAWLGDGDEAGLYVAGSGGRVCRFDAGTGLARWVFDVTRDGGKEALLVSSPAVVDEEGRRRVYFGAGLDGLRQGVLYCLEEGR